MKVIFGMSVSLHGKEAEESQVIIDTTVQENNITYALTKGRKYSWGTYRWETSYQDY